MSDKKTELKDLDPSDDPKGGALMEPTVRNITNDLGKITAVVPNGLPSYKIGPDRC